MAKPVTFESGIQYMLRGVGYQVLGIVAPNTVISINLMTRKEVGQPIQELWDHWHEGNLHFALPGDSKNLREEPGSSLKIAYTFANLSDLAPDLQEPTRNRYRLIEPLLSMSSRQRTQDVVEERIRNYAVDYLKQHMQEESFIWLGKHVGKGKGPRKPQIATKSSVRKRQPKANKREDTPTSLPEMLLPLPSYRTVCRWIKTYFESGGDIRSLMPAYHRNGPQEPYLSPLIQDVIHLAIKKVYLDEQRAPIKNVVIEVKKMIIQLNKTKTPKEQISTPSDRTIYRSIERLDSVEVDVARFGERFAHMKHDQYQAGPQPTRPHQRNEFDFATLDTLVVDDEDGLPIGRPTIAAIRDKFTGYPTGIFISFEPPSYRLVMECMFYAFTEKRHVKPLFQTVNEYLAFGVPEVLVVDNGIELHRDLELACLQLGIELQHMPVRKPWFKGPIERWFRTLDDDLIHLTPGTTFSNFLQRGTYPSNKYACITLGTLWKALHLWIVDVYTQDVHRGVGGHAQARGVPAILWQRALDKDFAPRLPPSRSDLLILLSRTVQRTIHQYGIEFENIFYQSDELIPLRSQPSNKKSRQEKEVKQSKKESQLVTIKYYPGDMSRIWVLNPFEPHNYIEVPARDQEYTKDLSLWKHRVIKKFLHEELKQSVNEESMLLAKARLQELLSSEYRRTKKTKTRTGLARWLDQQASSWMHSLLNQHTSSIVEGSISSPSLPSHSACDKEHSSHLQNTSATAIHEFGLKQQLMSEVEDNRPIESLDLPSNLDYHLPLEVVGVTLLEEPEESTNVSVAPSPPPSPQEIPSLPPATRSPRQQESPRVSPPKRPPSAEPLSAEQLAKLGLIGGYSSPRYEERN